MRREVGVKRYCTKGGGQIRARSGETKVLTTAYGSSNQMRYRRSSAHSQMLVGCLPGSCSEEIGATRRLEPGLAKRGMQKSSLRFGG